LKLGDASAATLLSWRLNAVSLSILSERQLTHLSGLADQDVDLGLAQMLVCGICVGRRPRVPRASRPWRFMGKMPMAQIAPG
jgi:hypothetical protein